MKVTPMMQQFLTIKEKAKDSILFFRLGDFYEMFFEDAEIAARELELVLTGKDCGMDKRAPMCGVPYHAANIYINKLVGKGYKVAICEQLENPSASKGIVKRDIIKVVTPGTYTDAAFLEDTKNNYIMSIYLDTNKYSVGICFSDISTGEFNCTSSNFTPSLLIDEISKFSPNEIILQSDLKEDILESIKERFSVSITQLDSKYFQSDCKYNLKAQFNNIDSLKDEVSIYCSNGLLKYIYDTQKTALSHMNKIQYYNILDYLSIDISSRKNLELTETLRDKSKKGSLLWVIDKTSTAMGGRCLRKWLEQPLISKEAINLRLNAVEELCSNFSSQEDLKEALRDIYDIERIVGKISSKNVTAKELISLKVSISKIPKVKYILKDFTSVLMKRIYDNLDELKDVFDLLDKSIMNSPAISLKEGNLIKEGYNSEVDSLRNAKLHGKQWISTLENEERTFTGIKSLKIGYNKVFGYYIEITKANLELVPEGRYIRKQTLSNSERYITPELKEMEEKILGAEEKLINLEYNIFNEIRTIIEKEVGRMKFTAELLSNIDSLNSFAQVAMENNYCKPNITNNNTISIKEGRHPVIEKMIPIGSFVSNDTYIDTKDNDMILITGPNMAGKSTYMRQVALIIILAQIGCFVPATKADISIHDKIFTRIGASDDLASGKSTFMVEMSEVSNILENATENSLVLLDEVGRGTSTYDGLSLAWAVIEYVCKEIKSKTLFATHYHELTKLEGKISGVKNYSVAVKKIDNDIVFLRKIIEGGADQSYGIEVAKLAGLPNPLLLRAKEILAILEESNKEIDITTLNLEKNKEDVISNIKDDKQQSNAILKDEVALDKDITKNKEKTAPVNINKQIDFYDMAVKDLIKQISSIDILNMTPIESLNKLNELSKKAKQFS